MALASAGAVFVEGLLIGGVMILITTSQKRAVMPQGARCHRSDCAVRQVFSP